MRTDVLTLARLPEILPVVTKQAVTNKKMQSQWEKTASTWYEIVRKAVPVGKGNGTIEL